MPNLPAPHRKILTVKEAARLKELKAVLEETKTAAKRWVEAAIEIKESRLYLEEAATWEEWCEKYLGRTAAALRKYFQREREKAAQRLIEQTTREPVSSDRDLSRFYTSTKSEPVKVMSAKLDRSQPIEMKVPPPLPVDAQELTAKVSELWKVAELLFRESAFAADGRFRRLHTVAQELFSATQGMLPLGSELPKNKPKLKARADQGQIVWYCKARGLPASDGDWFYDKMLQSGWKYGSQDVKDWQACIRNWERLRVFPSQKMAVARANGQAPPESMVMKQTRKLFKEIDGMNLGDK